MSFQAVGSEDAKERAGKVSSSDFPTLRPTRLFISACLWGARALFRLTGVKRAAVL